MRLPVLIIVIIMLLHVLMDVYIWRDIYKVYKCSAKKSIIYLVVSDVFLLLFIVAASMPRRDASADLLPIMWMLYTYLTTFIPKIIYLIFSLIGKIPALFKRSIFKSGLYLGFPLAIITFFAMWWGALVTRNQIEVKQINICSSKLPESFDNYRIVQFSDIHLGTWGNDTTFISNVVDSINTLKPDIIFFTGDIVNRNTKEAVPFKNVLSRLKAKDGVYSVLGNHDYGDYMDWKSPQDKEINQIWLESMQDEMNWKLLNNSHVFIKNGIDSIAIIGVENWGEPPFKQYGNLKEAYPTDSIHNLNDRFFKILLSHNPEHWRQEVSKYTNIDLTLSGHTHAMQFMIKLGDWQWSPSVWKYEEWAGLYDKNNEKGENVKIYVNVGLGEVAIPSRLGATPEITLITLKKSND